MAVSGFFGRNNLSKVEAVPEFPREIFANRPFPVKVELVNRKRFMPGFLLRAIFGDREVLFPYIERKARDARYVTTSFGTRGRHRIEEISLCSVFPFNFFRRCRSFRRSIEVVVFPEPKRCDLSLFYDRQERAKGEKAVDRLGSDSDILSVRDYIEGDPLKYISWKATARTGELKTKEFSSLSSEPVIIEFDAITAKTIEEKLSRLTYVIIQLLGKNVPVGLRINGTLHKPGLSPAHKMTLLRELALYDAQK